MIVKPRNQSLELKILRSLNARIGLTPKEETYYSNLEKGYKGELRFDECIENASHDRLVLNDLLFECNSSLFQIDSLLISSNMIYLFEVKNYEGDFFIEDDKWFTMTRTEIKNPLLQLQRNESLFRRLLQEHGFTFSIESYVIFINPHFQLYQTPLGLPIIFLTQLNRFIEKIIKTPSKLKDIHSKLAEQLLSLHLKESPHSRLPDYDYLRLEKGILCPSCHKVYDSFNKTFLICTHCRGREEYDTGVLRAIEEFKMLFPNSKITSNQIFEWCNIIKAKKTIRKILLTNYKLVRLGKSSYYIDKDY